MLKKVLTLLHAHKKTGFYDLDNMGNNPILRLLVKLYPESVNSFNKGKNFNYQIEHFYNLILLLLLTDIEISKKTELNDDLLGDLNTLSISLTRQLSAGIRKSISLNRLMFVDKFIQVLTLSIKV